MRSTLRIDEDVLLELREAARRDNSSLTKALNRALRKGLALTRAPRGFQRRRYRERTYAMGEPRVDLRKALLLATALEDEESLRKMLLLK